MRSIVGPPSNICWDDPWHEILHLWNVRARGFVESSGTSDWATISLRQYWTFSGYVARLPSDRWVRRVLKWQPPGRQKVGRPYATWDSKLEDFFRFCDLGDWQQAAGDATFWHNMRDDFVAYCMRPI